MSWPTINKHEIAIEFLEVALCLFDEKKFFSALHLAGAAEEIFHDTLIDCGKVPIKNENSKLAKKLGDSIYKNAQPSLVGIEKAMDFAKNSIKHVSTNNGNCFNYDAKIRPNIEAFRMIRRAIENADRCDVDLSRSMDQFMSLNELSLHNA